MEFEVRRHLSAPVQRVWEAWTQADQLSQWYSPGPIDWVIDQLDVRPGGRFRMHMETPDGQHVAQGTFAVVEAPHQLVQGPDDGSMSIHTTLTEGDDGTEMVVAMEGLPEEQHAMMRGAWNAGFDKLERLLAR